MDNDCKYQKSAAYIYEYVPSLSLRKAHELVCALKMEKPGKDFFMELADVYSNKNINQEYICLEMAENGINTVRMKKIEQMEGFRVQPFTGIRFNGDVHECNRLIKNIRCDNDIYLYSEKEDIDEMTVFWLRLALYEDNGTGIVFSSFRDMTYDENTMYAPYENIAAGTSESFIMRRDFIDNAGLFDQSFEHMQYAVFDYCMRALELGLRNITAKNSRFGKTSDICINNVDERRFFKKWHINTWKLYKENRKIHPLIHKKQDESFSMLSVGCGIGKLLSNIKGIYPNIRVLGAEDDEYAFVYGDRLIPYITGRIYDISDYIHTLILCGREKCFDYILLESVLEHINDPVDYLKNISRNLTEEGKIIVCIPNIMHHSVIAGLLRGNFTYGRTGLIYEGCTHFYTYNEAKKHFYDAGLTVEECFFSLYENENSKKDREMINKVIKIKDAACEVMFNAYEYFFLLKRY